MFSQDACIVLATITVLCIAIVMTKLQYSWKFSPGKCILPISPPACSHWQNYIPRIFFCTVPMIT